MRQHMKVRWVVVAGIHHKLCLGQAYQGWHFASLMQWLHCFSCALHPNPRASPQSACATRALPKRRTARWAARTTPAGSSTARATLSSAGCAGLRCCWPSCRPVGRRLDAARRRASTTALASLWLLLMLGLLAEHWCFFPNARHSQTFVLPIAGPAATPLSRPSFPSSRPSASSFSSSRHL